MNVILYSYRIQAFSQNEILSMLDKEIVDRIKQTDPHPFFKHILYVTGNKQPKCFDGKRIVPITWTQKAVQY